MRFLKIFSLFIGGIFLTGCAFTSSQVAAQVNQMQMRQYNQYAQARAEAVKAVMEALAKVDRGGMKIELDKSGRVKSIKYTDRLDPNILQQALVVERPKTYVPKSALSEFGDFFLKFGSFATPVASLWLNYKTAKSNNWANVEITKSNNNRDANMYNAFTSNFQNNVTTTTTNNNKDVEVTNNIEKVSSQVEKESVNNSSVKVDNNVEKTSDTTTTNNSEKVQNNNNNGGNQNVGQTNNISPQTSSDDGWTELGGDDDSGSDSESLPGAP